MRTLRPAGLLVILGFMIALNACAKPGSQTSAKAPAASEAAIASEPDAAKAIAVSSSPERPWYADRMEKLGFFVFPAPVDVGDFTVETLGGGSSTLSSAKGKIVLLNFWATWCPPCRAEMPSIEALWKKTKGKAFTVFAISVGEEKATVKAFIDEQKISYPIFLDPTGRLGAAFNASSIPTTYIMDKTGKAIAGVQGSREYDGPEVMALFSDLAAK